MRLLVFGTFIFAITFYTYHALKAGTGNRWISIGYLALWAALIISFFYQFSTGMYKTAFTPLRSFWNGLFVALFVAGMFVAVVLLLEDVIRLAGGLIKKVSSNGDQALSIQSRRKFISQIALGLAAVPFSSLLYGVFKGRYNYKVLKYTLHFEDLPEAFDGYRLTQISDIHSGSFDNRDKIDYAVNLINEQQSDTILFTGDMVNNVADEMLPWQDLFGKLTAKDGVFSVLGNHDYGDYVEWPNLEEKAQNLEKLKGIQKEMGFDLLLNESRYLERDGQRIALVGVENWGAGGFKKKGDLKKASEAIDKDDFKILMSHDPSHWEQKVINDDYHYHLTLSGHTHGMQFGIEIPGWVKWSPVKWRYTHWAGIYKEVGQYINVNRGFGFIGYPGRVGIWPEITVIELKKGSKPA
ncbi:metallophosphoesterase [Spongiivirga citrea]|uniref:Metallophosphoesterase n=1 Tax=Spongiivirga citrea TaxID=1481457 RepID=A0A6M0CPX5_9FLAO|nr:metallophosphoesterase [Spongiivirga citrea]NER18084.1 metallophosphoesterase [Spongiivirga citrea]